MAARLIRPVAIVVGVSIAGAAIGLALRQAVISDVAADAWRLAASRIATAITADERVPAVGAGLLRVRLMIAGIEQPADRGRPALRSGARFELALTARRGGIVEVHAVNPAGQSAASPVWTGTIASGERLHTPALRLAGQRGLETLRVVLRQPDGALIDQQQLQLWHL